MDNNLIKIDDLVRQRLSGGEERERSGAWLRMSELLADEMPQVRPAVFMWRRLFGGLAILVLLGGLSIGGYELNAYMKHHNADASNTLAVTGTRGTDHNPRTNTPSATTEGNNTIASTDNNSNNNEPNNNDNNSTPIANVNSAAHNEGNKDHAVKGTAAANTVVKNQQSGPVATNTVTASNSIDANLDPSPVAAKQNTVEDKKEATGNVAHNTTKELTGNKQPEATGTKTANVARKTVAPKTTGHNTPEAAETKTANVAPKKTTRTNGHNTPQVTGNSSTDNNTVVAASTPRTRGNTVRHSRTNTVSGRNTAGTSETKDVPVADAGNRHERSSRVAVRHNDKPVQVSHGTLALNSSSPATTEKPAVTKGHGNKDAHKTTGVTNPVVNGRSTSTKNPPAAKGIATTTKSAGTGARKGSSAKNEKTGNTSTVADNTTVTSGVADAKIQAPVVPVADKTAKDKKRMSEISAVNTQKGKRVIQRIILNQRLVRSEPKESNFHLDTISIENLTQYFEIAGVIKPAAPKNGAKTGGSVAGNNDLANNTTDEVAADPAINPAAATASNSSAGTKTSSSVKPQSAASKTVEHLNAAFNDIKYKAGHAQFAAGITGGVNATFFGPNNFKGFQLGMTAKFTFSDALAIMAELKYFNRVNSGYALHDDYYTYTQVSGGFNRVLVQNEYSIASLQSIEMPLTVRYCFSNFNIFGGLNLAYSFPINTGDVRPDPPPATFVTAMGNDNAGKVEANDFTNSKFGLGYTFGVSLQVAPKVTIDLKDVQTFWDNSKTQGAKYISSQLYRSPSFQLSLIYRLGGNKDKDK